MNTAFRRLDKADDFARIEIASALKQQKLVIPVLVQDTQMPKPDELPEAIRPLVWRNAVRLTHERFRADTQGLIIGIQQALEKTSSVHSAVFAPDGGRILTASLDKTARLWDLTGL